VMTAAMAMRAVQDRTRGLAEVGRRGVIAKGVRLTYMYLVGLVGVARKWLAPTPLP
jgi:hypothetical protein